MEQLRVPPRPPRQRWRVIFRRRPEAPPLPQREWIAAWEQALAASGLPCAANERGPSRPRLSFGAPLPVAIPAESEPLDIFLTEPMSANEVRAALASSLPAGHEIVDLYDVWVGSPPLPGTIAALTYRARVLRTDGEPLDASVLRSAIDHLIASPTLPRRRPKGDGTVAYDLRPLLLGIEVADRGPEPVLRIRVRADPERGMGRPDEVVAAIADAIGVTLETRDLVRERVETADEGGGGSGRR